jgi:hypothetical protein
LELEKIKKINIHFILSIERTGSTLLSTMLNMHPNILSTFEEPFAFTLYPKYKNVKKWTTKTIQEFCYDFYLFSEGFLEIQFGEKKNLEALLEKHKSHLTLNLAIKLTYLCFSPEKNKDAINTIVDKQLIFHTFLKKAAKIFNQSKFVILYRDPRDNALVRWRKAQKEKKTTSYAYFALTWNYIYGSITKTKAKIGEKRFLEIKYEDLVENPEIELQKICAFLEIPFNAIMLHYHEYAKSRLPAKMDSVSNITKQGVSMMHQGLMQKPNTEKVGLWKQHINEKDLALIWSVCGKLAEKKGYQKEDCKTVFKKNLNYYKTYFNFYLNDVLIPKLYYYGPFFMRYFIKKVKYGRNFKDRNMSSAGFYQRNLKIDKSTD